MTASNIIVNEKFQYDVMLKRCYQCYFICSVVGYVMRLCYNIVGWLVDWLVESFFNKVIHNVILFFGIIHCTI